MRVLLLAAVTLVSAHAVRGSPALDLELVADILGELEDLPVEERQDDEVSPELLDLYRDVELLFEMQKSNLSESRDGRGFLSKLSFLTGLKLGGFLSSSGTLAASQSINFLGKILNAALSVSYGNIGLPCLYGNCDPIIDQPQLEPLQKLPVIQEDVPLDNKKREKPDEALISLSESSSSTTTDRTRTPQSAREKFIKLHNDRVKNFNNAFDNKVKTRTGRVENASSEQGSS